MKKAILILLFAAIPSISTASNYAALVTKVVDGDTIKVLSKGKEQTVRLAYIDCPEKNQPFENAATNFVRSRIEGKEVGIKTKGRDKYGRTLAEVVMRGGKSLNYLLIKNGLAWAPNKQTTDIAKELQKSAQKEKNGLWSQPSPVPPWEARGPEVNPIAKFARNLRAANRHQQASTNLQQASAKHMLSTDPKPSKTITADDYSIDASARQSQDYVIIEGRISDGPVCDNLVITAYAASDEGGQVRIDTTASLFKGAKSTTFEGKNYDPWRRKGKARLNWAVTTLYIKCQ